MLRVVLVLLQVALRYLVFKFVHLGVKTLVGLPKSLKRSQQGNVRGLATLETVIFVVFVIVVRIDCFDLFDDVGQRAAISLGGVLGVGQRRLHRLCLVNGTHTILAVPRNII